MLAALAQLRLRLNSLKRGCPQRYRDQPLLLPRNHFPTRAGSAQSGRMRWSCPTLITGSSLPAALTDESTHWVEPCAIFAPVDPVNFVNLFSLDIANLNSYAPASNGAGT
jgi:hypothetical protein